MYIVRSVLLSTCLWGWCCAGNFEPTVQDLHIQRLGDEKNLKVLQQKLATMTRQEALDAYKDSAVNRDDKRSTMIATKVELDGKNYYLKIARRPGERRRFYDWACFGCDYLELPRPPRWMRPLLNLVPFGKNPKASVVGRAINAHKVNNISSGKIAAPKKYLVPLKSSAELSLQQKLQPAQNYDDENFAILAEEVSQNTQFIGSCLNSTMTAFVQDESLDSRRNIISQKRLTGERSRRPEVKYRGPLAELIRSVSDPLFKKSEHTIPFGFVDTIKAAARAIEKIGLADIKVDNAPSEAGHIGYKITLRDTEDIYANEEEALSRAWFFPAYRKWLLGHEKRYRGFCGLSNMPHVSRLGLVRDKLWKHWVKQHFGDVTVWARYAMLVWFIRYLVYVGKIKRRILRLEKIMAAAAGAGLDLQEHAAAALAQQLPKENRPQVIQALVAIGKIYGAGLAPKEHKKALQQQRKILKKIWHKDVSWLAKIVAGFKKLFGCRRKSATRGVLQEGAA